MIKYGTNNIGKIYFGSNLIGKAYFGSNLVYSSGSGPEPQPTTNIAYIRGGTNGSYIDTGITADNTVKVIIWARNWNPLAGYLFGCRIGNGDNCFGLVSVAGTNSGSIRIDFAQTTVGVKEWLNETLSNYHKYELYQGVCKVDDAIVGSATNTTFSNELNIHLFGFNANGTHSGTDLPIDICACKIYKNNVLVRDYTAVSSPSVGLYDAVSGTVFTNAGSGSFAYGTFNKDAYTPLRYVICSGSQYVDTGIAGGYSLPILAKVSPNSSTAKWNIPVSARYNTSNRCEFFFGNTTTANNSLSAGLVSTTSNIVSSGSLESLDLVLVKSNNVFSAYKNGSAHGTARTISASSSFASGQSLIIGGTFENGSFVSAQAFEGKIYYVGSGGNGSFVPATVNNVAGMYETYNDVFYPSASGTDFIAGPQLARTYFFRNRKIAIIGDSISTYDQEGYKYDSYSMYYPNHDVTSVNQTWWKMLIDDDEATLGVNLSYSGSRASTNSSMPTLYDRVGLIGDADTVIIALGTNDSNGSVSLGNYSYDTATSSLSVSNFREAYIKGIKGLLEYNPNVTIICAILFMKYAYRNSIIEIANHYGLKYVDCGNGYDLTNQVHPTALGMQQIERNFLTI